MIDEGSTGIRIGSISAAGISQEGKLDYQKGM